MVAMMSLFLLLYGAALVGWLKPVADDKIVTRLEPIIFVIIGYYFGRLPSRHNENTLKDEISRQTQRADASQHSKEQVQQAREALEEKMKNVRAALTPATHAISIKGPSEHQIRADGPVKEETLRQAVAGALSILNS